MIEKKEILEEMNNRSREVFRRVVEGYLADGEPVGSRTLSRESVSYTHLTLPTTPYV